MELEAIWQLRGTEAEHRSDPEASDLFQWLRMQRVSQRVALYASGFAPGSTFLHAVLLPLGNLERSWDDVHEWSGNPFDSPTCGLVSGGGEGARIELHAPWDEDQPAVFVGATQLVFGRSFDGRIGDSMYYELNQELTLAHGLHWIEERQAWCRFNDEGDIQDLAGVSSFTPAGEESAVLVWIDRQLLELHLAATNTLLAQMFDCVWIPDSYSQFDQGRVTTYIDRDRTLTCKFAIEDDASFFRGVHFVRSEWTARELGEIQFARKRAEREYETFIIQDWKNGRIVEWSCAPSALASYFDVDSQAPFQTSPVFFNPQVLDKYKADREKYRVADRSISCRNAWSLKTYDVNKAGQVHTYVAYLGTLPIAEQRYWKSFNEAPKAPISERAISSDFEAKWDSTPDGLRDLKATLTHLNRSTVSWFRLKQPDLLEHLNYPLTTAFKAWDDAIIDLAKLVVEGLENRALTALAKNNNRAIDPKWGSIRRLKEVLLGIGVDDQYAGELVSPFEQIQFLRTKLSAHAGAGEAGQIRRKLLAEFKTPKAHIETIASQLNSSLTTIADILSA